MHIMLKRITFSGGSIALSHPLGMSEFDYDLTAVLVLSIHIAGVRQVCTGLAELRRRDEQVLCTSMCVGSGMGAAAIFVNEAH